MSSHTMEPRALLSRALAALSRGQPADAERCVREVLTHFPRDFDALHILGVLHAQRGDFSAALDALQAALAVAPGSAEAWKNRAAVLQQLGRADEALGSAERAVRLDPSLAEAWLNRGNSLRALGRPEAAVASYERALQCSAELVDAWINLGAALQDLRRHAEALRAWRSAQSLAPQRPAIWCHSSRALTGLGRYEEGLSDALNACRLDPGLPDALLAAAVAQRKLARLEDCLGTLDRALALRADDPSVWNTYGNVLVDLGCPAEAVAAYDRALGLSASNAEILANRGVALAACEDRPAAIAAFTSALALAPTHLDALSQRGSSHLLSGDVASAVTDLSRVLELDPDYPLAASLLFRARSEICDWSDRTRAIETLVAHCRSGVPELPGILMAAVDDPEIHLAAARNFARYKNLAPPATPSSGRRMPMGDRLERPCSARTRLRIAYVSADFREHPVALLSAELFEKHDRDRFEIFAFSLASSEADAMRRRLEQAFDHFEEFGARSDAQIAAAISDRNIDIVVDMMGYTTGARPGVLKLRPAPIQVSWLGYPGTQALPHIDYLIADSYVIPEHLSESYSEPIVHLPHCCLPNDATRALALTPPRREEHGLHPEQLVLGCFSSSYKLTPDALDVWARVLAACPQAVLWLGPASEAAQSNLRREAARRGLDATRVVFAARLPSSREHLSRLRLADLYLDSTPYNGHSTVCEALWAGLPVITSAGRSFPARVAGSAVTALGLGELVAPDLPAYERRLHELCADRAAREQLRRRVEERRHSSPLFDTDRYCRNLESAYERIWEQYLRGEPPASLRIRDAGADSALA